MKCVRNASGSRHEIQPHTESACYGLDRKHPVGAFLSMWLLAGGGWDLWSNPPMVHPFIALAGGRRNSCRHREDCKLSCVCSWVLYLSQAFFLILCFVAVSASLYTSLSPLHRGPLSSPAHSSTAEQPWSGWNLWDGKPV